MTTTPRKLLRLPPLLILLAMALAGLAGCRADPKPPAAPVDTTPVVRSELPRQQSVADRTSLPADLLPRRRALLAAEVAGVVEALRVEDGQRVAAGALLAQVETHALEQAVAEAEALFRQAAAQHERAQALFERRSITQQQLLDAVTSRDVAQARLASARLQLDKSQLRAPWAGQVAARKVEVGDYVTPGQPMIELVDTSRLKVRAPAPASDVAYLQAGAPVTIRLDALPEVAAAGHIVRLAAELDPEARTLDVEAEIDNPGGHLRPGMLARLELVRQQLDNALLVPLAAVVDLGDRRALYVVENGQARRRIVQLGPVVGEQVVIAGGITAEDRVIVEGQGLVGEGQAVREAAR